MKKILSVLLSALLCLCFCITAYASDGEEEQEPADASTPRLMVTAYEAENGSVTPGESTAVKVKFKNQSQSKAVKNIKLSINDESGDIRPDGMGTQYVKSIKAGGTYTWELNLTASAAAQPGEHQLAVSCEYEDEYYNSYSAGDIIRLSVHQTVSLDYDGARLPVKVTQGDTVTVLVNLMNTGKTDLRNCRLAYEVEGLNAGGIVFAGEIPAGESTEAGANFQVSSEMLGETGGTVSIIYEDAYGEEYTKTETLSTTIVEKPEIISEEPEEEKKNPQWWAFLAGGAAAGGAAGAGIYATITSSKARREDELRL